MPAFLETNLHKTTETIKASQSSSTRHETSKCHSKKSTEANKTVTRILSGVRWLGREGQQRLLQLGKESNATLWRSSLTSPIRMWTNQRKVVAAGRDAIVNTVSSHQFNRSQYSRNQWGRPSILSSFFMKNTTSMRTRRSKVTERARCGHLKKSPCVGHWNFRNRRDRMKKRRSLNAKSELQSSVHTH